MAVKQWIDSLHPDISEALEDNRARVRSSMLARRLWERVLDNRQRRLLGDDLASAYYGQGGTIGMWMKLFPVSQPRAIIEVAYALGFFGDTDRTWLIRGIGENPAKSHGDSWPAWDASLGELRLNGKVARKVRVMKKPSGIQRILDAFEKAGWPSRIDNPLPETFDRAAIYQVVNELNKQLKGLRFHIQERSAAVTWELVKPRLKPKSSRSQL